MEWTVKVNDTEYNAPSTEILRQWYSEGRLTTASYIFHPLMQKWMYATEVEELRELMRPVRSWSPGVAALLSLLIPGAGQIYKGRVGAGLLWLLFVAIGYAMLVVPGLVLHLVCVINAAAVE